MKTNNSYFSRILVILIAVMMVFTMMPSMAFAAEGSSAAETIEEPPSNLEQSYVKWATKISSSWNPSTSPVEFGEYLFVVANDQLQKIDKNTGQIIAISTESVSKANTFDYHIEKGDGKLYIQSGTKVKCFDQELNCLWTSISFGGQQGNTPLKYVDGILYGATLNVSGTVGESGEVDKKGSFFAIDTNSALNEQGLMPGKWEVTVASYNSKEKNYSGSYWASATVIDNYVIFGSEGSVVYAFNKENGTIAATYDTNTEENRNTFGIRSGILIANNNIYFSRNDGMIFKVPYSIEENAFKFGVGTSTKICTTATGSVSTPVLHGDRLYVSGTTSDGTKAVTAVLNANDLSSIYTIPLGTYKQSTLQKGYTVQLVPQNDGSVRGYVSYYASPGSIIGFVDSNRQNQVNAFDIGGITEEYGSNYMASNPLLGEDGIIYFVNDSGILIAVAKNDSYLTELTAFKGSQETATTFTESFRTNKFEYTLVVPVGTESVKLVYKVLGDDTEKDITVPLKNQAVMQTIQVPGGKKNYTVNIRFESNISRLGSLAATNNNSKPGSSNTLDLNKEFVGTQYDYIVAGVDSSKTFINLWPASEDENATINVYAVKNVKSGKYNEDTKEITSAVTGGVKRYPVYFADGKDTAKVKITVKAENGNDSSDYNVTISKKSLNELEKCTVNVLAQKEEAFIAQYKNIEIDSNIAEAYGYPDNVIDGISVMDVLVTAHLKKYGKNFTPEEKDKYLTITNLGWITSAFESTDGFSFAVDGIQPIDDSTGNGALITDAKVTSDATVEFFFYDKNGGYTDQYTFFSKDGKWIDELALTAGESQELTLHGYTYAWVSGKTREGILSGSSKVLPNVSICTVGADGVLTEVEKDNIVIKTDTNGKATISFANAGTYYLTAKGTSKETVQDYTTSTSTEKDVNIIKPYLVVKVTAKGSTSLPTAYISVIDPKGKTYLSKTAYSISANETAYSLLLKTGLKVDSTFSSKYNSYYVEKIEDMGEFTAGSESGWMYKCNGEFPNYGASLCKVSDGDYIEWVYTRNYGGDVGGAGGTTEEVKNVTTDTKAGTTTAPTEVKVTEKTNADGTKTKVADVKVSADNQKEILKQAKEKKSNEIILVVSKDAVKDAAKADVTLDKSFIDSIVKDTNAKLTIKTPFGDKTYTQEELKAMSAAATGSTVTIAVEKAAEEPADDAAAKVEKAKSIVKDMKLTARSSKTAKKNVKAVLKNDAKTKAAIKELKDLGFTVKYRFYRSTKKTASYKAAVTKKVASYTNTSGKKGTKYFYKVQVRVYDENGKLVAKTALKQCKYASRTWTK